MITIGPHMSIAKGFTKAAKDVISMNANTFQFFSRNPRGSNYKLNNEKDIDEFQKVRKENYFGPMQAHAPYTMNLASEKDDVYRFAKEVIKEDIKRMDKLEIEYICFHPGSHVGGGIDKGIDRIIYGLNEGIDGNENIMILLETMPGKGTEIGYDFKHLKRIIDGVNYNNKLGICMDLCHVFSAGYDIKNNFNGVLEEFDEVIGIGRLKTIHLNDSMMSFGEKKDRHMAIGEGKIGLEAIINIMENPYIKTLPFYIETPLENEGHKREIEMIKDILDIN